LETAALKKAKVPIFGKWYFPDLPANVPLVNLSTGEIETFPAGFRAGAVLYVKEEDLKRAGIGPYKGAPVPATPPAPAAEALVVAYSTSRGIESIQLSTEAAAPGNGGSPSSPPRVVAIASGTKGGAASPAGGP